MEAGVVIGIVFEVLLVIFAVWGFLHEDKLKKFERAFFGAVLWTLCERFTKKAAKKGS